MKERAEEILSDLEHLQEQLLGLSDDLWLSIDHNDQEELEEGIAFKKAYNEKAEELNRAAQGLSRLIQEYFNDAFDAEAGSGRSEAENERVIRELDRTKVHHLGEDFTYKRPYGFVLDGTAYEDVRTWTRLYKLVCRQLVERHPERFRTLPGHPAFVTKQGRRIFSQNKSDHREPTHITDGIYTETHASANRLCDFIETLLEVFEIPKEEMKIYLREDRDAGTTK